MEPLRPSLWRTCRVLAHPKRLDMLRELHTHGLRTVSQLAESVGLPLGMASSQLRAINARGLISAKREGRYVFYSPEPNPGVDYASDILHALENAFDLGTDNPEIVRAATAYTHSRRLDIVHALGAAPMPFEQLTSKTAISPPALARHLRKLEARGLVDMNGDLYKLTPPADPFALTLMLIAQNKLKPS